MDFKRSEYLKMICANKYGDIKSMEQHQLNIDVGFVVTPAIVTHHYLLDYSHTHTHKHRENKRERGIQRFTCIHFWLSTFATVERIL